MLQLRSDTRREFEFADLPPLSREDMLLWKKPSAFRIAMSSMLGGASGALISALMFPSDPALIFGAVLGAYGGFLAAAIFGEREHIG